jgi:hypothetical protein
MKVVAVYKGSVVVEYEVMSDKTVEEEDNVSSASQLRSIESKLNKLIKQNDAESHAIFGAPILSASTNEVGIINDPNYNPITAPTVRTTPVTNPTGFAQIEEDSVTVTMGEDIMVKVDQATGAGMIGVFAILVGLVICCFGSGVAVVCFYSVSKASKEVLTVQTRVAHNQKMKKEGRAQASESQVEIDHQFELPDNLDVDIFTAKKRKMNVDEVRASTPEEVENSTKKLIPMKGQTEQFPAATE